MGLSTQPRSFTAARQRRIVGGWTPFLLANTSWWEPGVGGAFQDAAGTTPATAAAQTLGGLFDQGTGAGGTLWNFTQASAGSRPPLTTLNGRLAVQLVQASATFLSNATFNRTQTRASASMSWVYRRPQVLDGFLWAPGGNSFAIETNGFVWFHSGNFIYADVTGGNALKTTNPVILTAVFDGAQADNATRLKVWVNGRAQTPVYSNPVASTFFGAGSGVVAGVDLGRQLGAGNYAEAELGGAVFSDAAWDDTTRGLVEGRFQTRFIPTARGFAIEIGDSLSKGYPDHQLDGLDPVTLLGGLLPSGWTVQNSSTIAFTYAQLQTSYLQTAQLLRDTYRDVSAGGLGDVVILQGMTNNIMPTTNNQAAATALAECQTFVDAIRAASPSGRKIYVCTVPPVVGGGGSNTLGTVDAATFNGRQATCNAALLGGGIASIDGVIDWHTGSLADASNLTNYNADGIHRTAAGNLIAAQRSAAVVSP